MSSILGVHAERLADNQQVTTTTYTKSSAHSQWVYSDSIVAKLQVSDVNAGAGDSLNISVYTLFPNDVRALLGGFSEVLGNTSDAALLNQVISFYKAPGMSWSEKIQIEAVPAGGTADFTFTVEVFGS